MRKLKILILDDNINNIQNIARYLEEFHPEYRLYQATHAKTAIHIAESTAIDLIICDWDMPDINGIELTRILKSNTNTKHIPVII
jgi:CheY-like chemotaxis protein